MAKPTSRLNPTMEPLHIYQDDFEHAAPIVSHAPMPSTTKSPRKALQPTSTNLNAASSSASSSANQNPLGHSPLKCKAKAANPLQPCGTSAKLNMVSIQPPAFNSHQTDSMQKKAPAMSRFKTVAQKPLASAASRDSAVGKENAHPVIYPAPPTPTQFNLPLENYYQKPSGKRVLMEAAPIKDARPQKKIKLEAEVSLPPHDSFPPIKDDGQKPAHSYATLIGMAILRSPKRRLTLAQIYRWISDNYSFYNAQDAGWQNSIRHNLSLNKAFIKQERPKDDKGKGNYWAIMPGMEAQFMKEKPTRKSQAAAAAAAAAAATSTTSTTTTTLAAESTRMESVPHCRPPPPGSTQEQLVQPPAPKLALPKLPQPQQATAGTEPSSDATIPCPVSDLPGPEELIEPKLEFDLGLDFYSAAIHSSPPIPRHIEAPHNGTPPPTMKAPASSVSRSHKRKFASMDDSGYISSLDSSAMRSNKASGSLLTSEADRSQSRRGRGSDVGTAEFEISRLRGRSYESPTKSRSHGLMPPSSSPLRHASGQMGPPPMTPAAMKIKAPPRPPPSVSPNTNLRHHRELVNTMLNSPMRRANAIGDEVNSWSPAFNIDNQVYNYEFSLHDPEFDVWPDPLFPTNFEPSSPVKRSTRKELERASAANPLGEISNSAQRRSITSAPLMKLNNDSPCKFDTPSKVFGPNDSPSKMFSFSPSRVTGDENSTAEADWFNEFDFQDSELMNDGFQLDISLGFERIGGVPPMSQPHPATATTPTRVLQPRQHNKPGLERSYSTTF